MKVTSQDMQKDTMASTTSALTVHTRTLTRGITIHIDLATAGLLNISVKPAVKSLCLIPRKEGTSRMASAPSNVLTCLHFNILCGNTPNIDLSSICHKQIFFLTDVANFRFVVNVETNTSCSRSATISYFFVTVDRKTNE